MHEMDPRHDVASRVRDAHERPREYNAPGRPDTQSSYYDGHHVNWIVMLILTVAALAVLGLIGFIAFNLISN